LSPTQIRILISLLPLTNYLKRQSIFHQKSCIRYQNEYSQEPHLGFSKPSLITLKMKNLAWHVIEPVFGQTVKVHDLFEISRLYLLSLLFPYLSSALQHLC